MKFVQQKAKVSEKDNNGNYKNVCEARQTLRILLQYANVPIFDSVRTKLEYLGYIIETAKQTITSHDVPDEEKNATW